MRALFRDVERTLTGGAWHGPSLLETLDGITPEQAVGRPISDAHSIWEIVNHTASWMEEVADRLRGEAHDTPVNEDWVVAAISSGAQWAGTLQRLADSLVRLESAIAGFDAERLDDAAVGDAGPTFRETLAGLAQHNAYHAGQILLLRKLVVQMSPNEPNPR